MGCCFPRHGFSRRACIISGARGCWSRECQTASLHFCRGSAHARNRSKIRGNLADQDTHVLWGFGMRRHLLRRYRRISPRSRDSWEIRCACCLELAEDAEPSQATVISKAVGKGYHPSRAGESFGGQYMPGDLLEKGANGYRICGRVSDFINIAGRKVTPQKSSRCWLLFPRWKVSWLSDCPSVPGGGDWGMLCRPRGN